MAIFRGVNGPVEFDRCPLKPDTRHFGVAHRCRDNRSSWPRQRWLVWREPAGWVLAFGDPHVCTVRRAGLASREEAMAWQAELVRREMRMHYAAGLVYGRVGTCGKKVDYMSSFTARDAAKAMSEKYQRALEPYPCVWCGGWHIGREMTGQERGFFSGLGVVWLVRDAAAQGMLEEVEDLERRELFRRLWCAAARVNLCHVPGATLPEWLAVV